MQGKRYLYSVNLQRTCITECSEFVVTSYSSPGEWCIPYYFFLLLALHYILKKIFLPKSKSCGDECCTTKQEEKVSVVGHKQKVGAGGGDVIWWDVAKQEIKLFSFSKALERHRHFTVPKCYSKYLHYLQYYSQYHTNCCSPDVSKWLSGKRHFFSSLEISSSCFYPLPAVLGLACIPQEINPKWSFLV